MSEYTQNHVEILNKPEVLESAENLLKQTEISWHATRGINLAALDGILKNGIEPTLRADGKVCVCVCRLRQA